MKDIQHCAVCQSADLHPHFIGHTNRNRADGQRWPVVKCGHCSHVMMAPQPSWDELSAYYSNQYSPYTPSHGAEDAEDRATVARAMAKGEFRHIPIPAGKSLLDLGCGAGYFLRICKKLGADTFGIEPSTHGYQAAIGQGLNVFNGTLEDFHAQPGPRRRFDLITSNHVIEHTPEPVRTLSLLKDFLAPGGMIWISVPNAGCYFSRKLGPHWHATDLPYHLQQFNAASMATAGRLAGLEVARQYTTSLPSATAASIRHHLRRNFLIPERLTARIGAIETALGPSMASRQDARGEGEALVTEFRLSVLASVSPSNARPDHREARELAAHE